MEISWFGQAAFSLRGSRHSVFIDPFSAKDMARAGMTFAYPPIPDASADVLLITHEHMDHNAASVVKDPQKTVRSTAGTFETPLGKVVAVASEHDPAAGTQRGPNAIFVFELDGLRICHMGDFGQAALRSEQREAIGKVDLLFVPVGGGPTVGAEGAAQLVSQLGPRWVIPMHYRTDALNFLEPADAFLEKYPNVTKLDASSFSLSDIEGSASPAIVVPAPPLP